MRRALLLFLAAGLLAGCLGCSMGADSPVMEATLPGAADTPLPTETLPLPAETLPLPTETPAPTVDPTVAQHPIDYTVDYHRTSSFLKELFGEQLIADTEVIIDAFLAGETHVSVSPDCNSELYMNRLGYALSLFCPPLQRAGGL